MQQPAHEPNAQFRWSGLCLGFGLGGFFDGILLHQILQWHHLLSGLTAAGGDLGFLIMTDGLFHLFMYLVTVVGIVLLARARHELRAPTAGRALLAFASIGFGSWHVADAVLSHWLLGLHRIRMDVPNPLVWDVAWLVIFGLVPLAIGFMPRRRGGGPPRGGRAAAALLVLAVAGGVAAALPAPNQTARLVVFRDGITPKEAFAALDRAGARVVWIDASEKLWAVEPLEGARLMSLYLDGALLVSQSPVIAGCLNWVRTASASPSRVRLTSRGV